MLAPKIFAEETGARTLRELPTVAECPNVIQVHCSSFVGLLGRSPSLVNQAPASINLPRHHSNLTANTVLGRPRSDF